MRLTFTKLENLTFPLGRPILPLGWVLLFTGVLVTQEAWVHAGGAASNSGACVSQLGSRTAAMMPQPSERRSDADQASLRVPSDGIGINQILSRAHRDTTIGINYSFYSIQPANQAVQNSGHTITADHNSPDQLTTTHKGLSFTQQGWL